MPTTIRNGLNRRLGTAVEIAALLALGAWALKIYVAREFAKAATVRNLQTAIRLDPSDAEYQLQLGGMYQYNLTDINPEAAIEHLQRAAELNPDDPQPWVDLGAAFEFEGKISEAESCLERADALAPRIPAVQWAIGNFELLHGNTVDAFRHFKIVLAGTPQYNQILFDTAWKASQDGSQILSQLIPRSLPTEFAYLDYLAVQQRFPEAANVWRRIANSGGAFDPHQTAGYIDRLIGAQHPEQAFEVWQDLKSKGLVPAGPQGGGSNLLNNGGFEDEILNMGFDWRIASLEGVIVGRDRSEFHSPSTSLFIQFSGKENVTYRHVFQYVKVEPNQAYRLQGFMKTEGITTDSGPRLEVRDAYNPSALDKYTDDLKGDSMGWTSLAVSFTTGPKTSLVIVSVTRLPSQKIDNQIAGKVWLDDVSLSRASASRPTS